MEAVSIEKECSALGGLFQTVIGDMKSSYPIWEDFITKAGKLQSQLRATVVAAAAFLDAFQKVADLATSTRGGTRDIGSALTRMCMRHRSIEAKLRQFSMAFIDCLINPLQEQMEEWKRGVNTLDKDHAKEHKKARSEIKKRSLDTLKLQKKAKKADALGRGDVQPQLHNAMQDVSDKYLLLEETEKQAVRKALIEERSRFCAFVSMLRPVVDEEISMLGEVTHLQTISDDLKVLTLDPHKLPPTSEQVILDLKGSDCNWSFQTPPSSPSTMSRKSSMCSSLNSVNSSDSRSSDTPHSHPPSPCYRYRSSTLPQQAPARLSSVSSHDSGFISQLDAYTSKSPSPMPQETLPQPCSSSGSSETSETCQSVSGGSSPTSSGSGGPLASADKDWAKPGPYDQPMVNTLRRRKDKEPAAPADFSSGPAPARVNPVPADCSSGPARLNSAPDNNFIHPLSPPTKVGVVEVREDLALALTQGLQQGAQRSSRDSLQCSSGYSTQSTTPCCSEDTIPSQVSDYDYFSMGGDQEVDQQEFDKSSTIPRNSDISQSYRRMFQSKRPASTAGLPSTAGPVITSPGVATIRRTPSTKPSARRGATGPIPIRTPVIPVQMPAVPGPAGGVRVAFPGGLELGAEEPEEDRSPDSAQGDLGMLPLASWRGQASTNPPPAQLSPHQPGVQEQDEPGPLEVGEVGGTVDGQGENMLLAIQRGVKLRRTNTNDRSAPRIA
ncbi:protein MTSS 1 isoform X7 [Esox lucius]|uniref:protein MTSS 1 isoform X7 n=1 Tax=Esox lucius TaxID=8010 RepID=UPI001476902E|nr:protein MTSS 1 isoform X7 [Esox lucius]